MSNTLSMHTKRLNPDEPIHVTFEPEADTTSASWRVTPTDDVGNPGYEGDLSFDGSQLAYAIPIPPLNAGGYLLQVLTAPARGGRIQKVSQTVLAEHHFVVQAPRSVPVTLVAEPPDTDHVDPLPTFERFRNYLKEKCFDVDTAPGPGGDTDDAFGGFGDDNYLTLKRLAKRFVASQRCAGIDELAQPYLRSRLSDEPNVATVFAEGRSFPCVELIWNYWIEEGMMVQTLNLILARFQNRVVGRGSASLARFDVTPLAPLHGLLYAFVDDEQHRMTVRRRAAEYEYQYGLRLIGRAVPTPGTVFERRSGFLAAFHQVIFEAHEFFRSQDDLTVSADAFPLYRALRECHLVLSQGSHNQYGQLALAARAEFLVMQLILGRPEMREFLGGRPMTPYPEEWMGRVDTMKSIQGWTETSVMHFHDLATIGERLVLTARLGSWADPNTNADKAKAWASAFRQPIQKYAAAYRAVTGIDLSRAADPTMPSLLILDRLNEQRRRA